MTADASGPASSPGDDAARLTDAQKSLRAQMLATEHWSLLASRSTTQSEVLTRIAIFLTLVSAGLVTLGVLGNATEFSGWFGVAALGVLFLLVRARHDHAVAGVQHRDRGPRLRPGDESPAGRLHRPRSGHRAVLHDGHDRRPARRRSRRTTRSPPADPRQVFASSMMLILVVNAALVGLFVGSAHVSRSRARSAGRSPSASSSRLAAFVGPGWPGATGGYLSVWRLHRPLRPSSDA